MFADKANPCFHGNTPRRRAEPDFFVEFLFTSSSTSFRAAAVAFGQASSIFVFCLRFSKRLTGFMLYFIFLRTVVKMVKSVALGKSGR